MLYSLDASPVFGLAEIGEMTDSGSVIGSMVNIEHEQGGVRMYSRLIPQDIHCFISLMVRLILLAPYRIC